ncbi:MAG: polysaccharide deacetylase family protein [Candidatus Hydrogenedentes bacterium]|nr:polysaccharide deacetylase family protein [Candidatus Hydrogenedentota bacterium]
MNAMRNCAARLGWHGDARVVLFHVDDAGLCRAANLGVIAALEAGLARSCSVMTPCPGAEAIAAYLQARPDADAGIHLTLTSEFGSFRWRPLTLPEDAPGLAGPEGFFWPSARDVAAHATPEEVAREIRAQTEAGRELGIPITHLDAHMGTAFLRADFFDRYARAGAAAGVPVLAAVGPASRARRLALLARRAACKVRGTPCYEFPAVPGSLVSNVWDAGLPVVDRIHADALGWPREEKKKRLMMFLRALRPGITVVLLHCALPADDLRLLEDSGDSRVGDTEAITDPEVRATVEAEGIVVTSWRELKRRRDAAAALAPA